MAITVFDGVGKFSADSSQLDQFIVKLERGLTGASDKAAASTHSLKIAQDEFRASIKAVSVEGGNTAENMARLAAAEKNLALASAAAKQEHAALRTELTQTTQSAGLMAEATTALTGQLVAMVGVLATIEGFKSLIMGTQQTVLHLEQLSQKTGIAIDTLAGLEHVSASAGVEFEAVAGALTKLEKSQALAAEGGQAQITAFQRIGISVNELKKLSPEELFYRVAGAMANSKNHAEENASAFALLGRGGAALIPIFQQNSGELRAMVEEAAKASGVTKEAGQAALEWERQTAMLTETIRSGLIPVMEVVVPVIKAVEQDMVDLGAIILSIVSIIRGAVTLSIDEIEGLAKVYDDVIHGDFKKAASDASAIYKTMANDLGKTSFELKQTWAGDAEAIKDIWKVANPTKPISDDMSDLGKVAKESGDKLSRAIREAQMVLGSAVIDLLKQQSLQRIEVQEQGISLATAATKQDFIDQLNALAQFDLQKRAVEAKAAEDIYQLDLTSKQQRLAELEKEGSKTIAEQTTLAAQIEAMQFKHQAKLIEISNAGMAALRKATSQPIPLINAVPEGTDQIENAVTKGFRDAEAAAKELGFTLRSQLDTSLESTFDNYAKLDKLFHQGIITQHDLDKAQKEVIKSELQYAIATGASQKAVEHLKQQLRDIINQELAWARATHASTKAIQELEKELAQLDNKGKKSLKDFTSELQHDMQNGADSLTLLADTGKAMMGELTLAVGDAFAAMITGQESFGEAMIHGTEKMIGSLAQQWAMYFAAKGIADIFLNPALGAAELAAAVALEAVAGVMNALGSASSSKSTSAPTGTPGPEPGSPAATAGAAPSQGRNTTHLGTGGIVLEPTAAVVGDSQAQPNTGAPEAILPLNDSKAMQMVAAALMPAIAQFFPKGHDVAFPPIFNTGTTSPAAAAFQAPLLTRDTVSIGATPAMQSAGPQHHDGADMWRRLFDEVKGKGKSAPAEIHIKLESDIPQLVKKVSHPLAKQLSEDVHAGRVRLLSSDSIRHTKRS